jgi:hypothetical protein
MFHILFEKVNSFYERQFKRYGRFLAKYHYYIILISLIVNLLLGFGIFRLNMLTDSDDLFMTVDSEARRDEMRTKRIFNTSTVLSNNFFLHQLLDMGTWAEINFVACSNEDAASTSSSSTGEPINILQPKYIDEIKRINDYILNNAFVQLNSTHKISYEHVCAKRGGKCLIDGLSLLDEEFYVDWLSEMMDKKTQILSENGYNQIEINEDKQKNQLLSTDFRFYIKMNGTDSSLTDLTYNLGKRKKRFI